MQDNINQTTQKDSDNRDNNSDSQALELVRSLWCAREDLNLHAV